MLARVLHALFALALAAPRAGFLAKPRKAKPHPIAEDQAHELWYWIEDYADIVFPLIGVVVLGLIVWAIRRGMVSQEAELQAKGQQKDQIVRLMRSKLLVNPEVVSSELSIDRFRAATLLEELQREGKLVQQKVAGGTVSYRLKGL